MWAAGARVGIDAAHPTEVDVPAAAAVVAEEVDVDVIGDHLDALRAAARRALVEAQAGGGGSIRAHAAPSAYAPAKSW